MIKKTYDVTFSTEIEAEHPMWAKPFINGPIKAFFVPSVKYGREIVELVQRTDIDFDNVTIDRAWDLNKWGFGDFYDVRAAIWDFHIMLENLEKVVTSDEKFDVMVIPSVNGWGYYSENTRKAILQRVENGAGLVLMQPFNGEGMGKVKELEKLSPLKCLYEEGFGTDKNAGEGFHKIAFDKLSSEKWVAGKHYITAGIPFELFPFDEMAYYPYEADGEVIIKSQSGAPIAAVREYGKGRVVAYGYYPRDILPQHREHTGSESTYDSIVDGWGGAKLSVPYNYLEYFYGLIYRSMVWAAGKEPGSTIRHAAVCDNTLTAEVSGHGHYSTEYRINDLYDNMVFEGKSDTDKVQLPEWLKLGGEYRVDLFVKDNGKVTDWVTLPVKYPRKSSIKDVSLSDSTLNAGDTLTARVTVDGSEGEVEIRILDDFGRILYESRHTAKGSETIEVVYKTEEQKSLHIRLQADLIVEGHRIDRFASEGILVTPQNRKMNDFEVFMSPQNRGHRDFLDLIGKLSREMGVTGLFPGSSRTVAMSGAEGMGVYWYHRGPYAERKEKYLRTKDKKYLQRVPCLNDPEFWAATKSKIQKAVGENKKYGPVSYFANDEGSVTCYIDELDLCFCPHCMREMRKWLKGQYKDLDALNQEWETNFKDWDEVVPYTTEEARNTRKFASWGDHKRFMEFTFLNAYKNIVDFIQSQDPKGVARMSGCQESTAHSGYDYYQLHQYLGCFEAYPGGNQYEFHRSFAKPDTMIGGWFGYGADGVMVHNRIWYALFHQLTLISIFWEYSCINPDFTFSKSARDMGEILREIKREGIGKLLLYGTKREGLGIAVHYSMASIHGSYILNDAARFQSNRQGWVDILEDMGYQYNFVASQQIEAGELLDKGYKVLVMPYSIALSDREAAEIKRFAENGGTVIGDLQTGIMDEHSKLYGKGKLDDVFGIERLTNEATSFYINGGFVNQTDFPYFNYRLSHIPGLDYGGTGLAMAEIGIRATSGKAAYVDDFAKTVASVVVNEIGSGKGIYLNFALDKYPSVRMNEGGGYSLRQIIKNVLSLTGVEKYAELKTQSGEDIENGFETVYYSDGSARYIGLLKELGSRMTVGHDGLAVGSAGITDLNRETVNIKLPRAGHVYDIRAEKYLGCVDSLEAEIQDGDTKLLSVLPYKVNAIRVELGEKIERGSELCLKICIDSDKPDGEYSNVLNIKFYDPKGEYEWLYSENISVESSNGCRYYKIPYNEVKGKWKVVVKDVATGCTGEKGFEIV